MPPTAGPRTRRSRADTLHRTGLGRPPLPDDPTTQALRAAGHEVLAVVEGEHGPYDYKGTAPEAAGPVHNAVVTSASGRQLVLLSYEKQSSRIPETEICGADGAVYFPAYYPNRWDVRKEHRRLRVPNRLPSVPGTV
ncbi:hypothetical protein [Streptomyces sp. NBC_00503]|uniref:hypothetical protein n=1 Tax=Streptomyces sp. NBC_00503 TaxID=2903659 RepID=UPI002E802898|nr:hypothetical protein [Streptomyces sp. NBC_00503]WUD85532.1 hypothetical protein OG490_36035 [Streptomyces sp. NBC_00503]